MPVLMVGEAFYGRVQTGAEFFGVSRRRASRDGKFNVIIVISVVPKVFSHFYNQLAHDRYRQFSLGKE